MSQFRSVNMRFEELDLTYLREFEIFLRQRGNVNYNGDITPIYSSLFLLMGPTGAVVEIRGL